MNSYLKEIRLLTPETISRVERFFNDCYAVGSKLARGDVEGRSRAHTSNKISSFLTPPPNHPDEAEVLTEDEDDEITVGDSGEVSSSTACELGEGEERVGVSAGGSSHWLKHCLLSASVGVDTLVVAAVQRFVILQAAATHRRMEIVAMVEIDREAGLAESTNSTAATIAPHHHLYITSLLVLPVASKRRTSASSIDWTCVCVGLSSGELRFYTESGILLFVEECTRRQVAIKHLRFGSSLHAGGQELSVLTARNCLVVIEGLSLWNALQDARRRVAKGEQRLREISHSLQLQCHQLELDRLRGVGDFQPLGPTRQAVFDQYVRAARSHEGKYARISPNSLPAYNQYFCCSSHHHTTNTLSSSTGAVGAVTGHKPFAAFLWHNAETLPSTVISDAIYGLAGQLTQQIPSFGLRTWLGLGTSRRDQSPAPPNKVAAADSRSTRIHARNTLMDGQRTAERCFAAPAGWPYVALADAQGRVLLVNTRLRQVVRVWKGYRQARCTWLEAVASGDEARQAGDSSIIQPSRPSATLFIAIFAPKRSLLELWSVQNGSRIASFELDGGGKVVPMPSSPHDGTLLGPCSAPPSTPSSPTVLFLDSLGRLLTLQAPFHLAASSSLTGDDGSVAVAHDENILREFSVARGALSPSTESFAEIWLRMASVLRTESARKTFLACLIDADVSDISTPEIISAMECWQRREGNSASTAKLNRFINKQMLILNLYSRLEKLWSAARSGEQASHLNPAAFEEISKVLRFTHQEDATPEINERTLEMLRPTPLSAPEHVKNHHHLLIQRKDFRCKLELLLVVWDRNDPIHHGPIGQHVDDSGSREELGEALYRPLLAQNDQNGELASSIDHYTQVIPTALLLELYLSAWLSPNSNPSSSDPFALAVTSTALLRQLVFGCCASAAEASKRLKLLGERIRKRVFKSPQVTASLLLCLQLRSLNEEFAEVPENFYRRKDGGNLLKGNGGGDESGGERDERFMLVEDDEVYAANEATEHAQWEWSIDEPNEWLDLLIRHLLVLSLLVQLPDTRAYPLTTYNTHLSLEQLSQGGAGFYREHLAAWAVQRREAQPRELAHLMSGVEAPVDELNPSDRLGERAETILRRMQSLMPLSMRAELILCDCCWEAASDWFRDESRRARKLQLCIDYLALLDTAPPRLQHGMALIIWDTFLRASFEKLAHTLYNSDNEGNAGGLDGNVTQLAGMDRILKRDVLVVERDLAIYVDCVQCLLRHLASSIGRMGEGDTHAGGNYVHVYEDFIERFIEICAMPSQSPSSNLPKPSLSRQRRRPTLTEMVYKCKPVNYHLVLHHIHLATVMQLQLTASVSCRLPSVFDSNGRRALFKPLHSHPLVPLAGVDERCRETRQKFLESVVETVGTLPATAPTHRRSWRMVIELASEWQLDMDVLQIKLQELQSLYACGLDSEGEAMLPKIQKRHLVVPALLPIIASRVHGLLEEEGAPLRLKCFQCSAASSATMQFVESQKPQYGPADGDDFARSTQRLISSALNVLKGCQRQKPSSSRNQQQQGPPSKGELAHLLKELAEICRVTGEYKTSQAAQKSKGVDE